MIYVKPQIVLCSVGTKVIESASMKEGWAIEAAPPHLFVTSAAYEADE